MCVVLRLHVNVRHFRSSAHARYIRMRLPLPRAEQTARELVKKRKSREEGGYAMAEGEWGEVTFKKKPMRAAEARSQKVGSTAKFF